MLYYLCNISFILYEWRRTIVGKGRPMLKWKSTSCVSRVFFVYRQKNNLPFCPTKTGLGKSGKLHFCFLRSHPTFFKSGFFKYKKFKNFINIPENMDLIRKSTFCNWAWSDPKAVVTSDIYMNIYWYLPSIM